ncbi:MAG: type II toxin-antitoxin system RelE/ParE family toxin [Gemmatimonadales bacterium]
MRVIWSPLALERVESIARTIASGRPEAAEKWVRMVFARVAQLTRYPKSGPMVPELTRPEVRQLAYPPYRIVYKVEANRVVILTIRHDREQLDPEEVRARE